MQPIGEGGLRESKCKLCPTGIYVNKKILIDLIGLLLIALIVVVGYKLSPLLLPKSDVTITPDAQCNLQQTPCAVALPGGGEVELAFGTLPVPLVQAFPVKVRVQGDTAQRVEIDFSGVDMNMGFNRLALAPQTGGVFAGEATLPVCVTGRMIWQATVLLEQGRTRIAVPFRFVTGEGH